MSRSIRTYLCAALVASPVVPACAATQAIPRQGAVTAADCRSAIDALDRADPDVTTWDAVPECGPAGAGALARALTRARTQPGAPLYLQAVTNAARSVRDGGILEAAETLARDREATRAARVAGLVILLGQYDPALWFPLSYSWDQLVSSPLPACKLAPLTDTDHVAQHAMPADYVARIGAVMRDLAGDSESDVVVRRMAACLSGRVRP